MVTSLYTFTAESAGESNLKIGQHLANLQTGLWCPVFFIHRWFSSALTDHWDSIAGRQNAVDNNVVDGHSHQNRHSCKSYTTVKTVSQESRPEFQREK